MLVLQLFEQVLSQPVLGVLVAPIGELDLEQSWFLCGLNLNKLNLILVSAILQSFNVRCATLVASIAFKFVGFITNPEVEVVPGIKQIALCIVERLLREGRDLLHPHVSTSVADFKEHGLEFAVHEHRIVDCFVSSPATQELPKLIGLLAFIEF